MIFQTKVNYLRPVADKIPMDTIKMVPHTELEIGETYFFVIDEPFCGAHTLGVIKEIDGMDRIDDYTHITLESGIMFINAHIYPKEAYNAPWIYLQTAEQAREQISPARK